MKRQSEREGERERESERESERQSMLYPILVLTADRYGKERASAE